MHNKKKSAFVSWGRYIGRSQGFIDNLIMEPIYIKRKLASKYLLPFDYGLRFIETLFLLNQCKPKFVLVMTPPIFAAAAVFLFSTLHKTPFMLDNHSGSFESSKWKWSLPILRFLSKKAKYAIVTNSVHYDLLRNWGAKPLIMSDPPPIIPKVQSLDDKSLKLKHPSVVVVNTYSKNEAIDVVVEAAKQIEGINFYITGDKSKADPTLLQGLPENIILTGWLSLNDFWFIMKNCNLIMTLIDQENTI